MVLGTTGWVGYPIPNQCQYHIAWCWIIAFIIFFFFFFWCGLFLHSKSTLYGSFWTGISNSCWEVSQKSVGFYDWERWPHMSGRCQTSCFRFAERQIKKSKIFLFDVLSILSHQLLNFAHPPQIRIQFVSWNVLLFPLWFLSLYWII